MIRSRARHLCAASLIALTPSMPALAQVSVRLPSAKNPIPPVMSAPPPQLNPPAAPPPGSQQPGVSVPLPGAPATPPTPVVPIGKYGRPDINPYERDIELTVPLTYRTRPLGEVPVLLTHDDRFVVDTAPFLKLLSPLLNATAQAKLAALLANKNTFTNDDLAQSGVSLVYDPGSLSVVVLQIAPTERAMESLFKTPTNEDDKSDLLPAFFSAYVNANVLESRIWGAGGRWTKPSYYANGAARVGPVVLEADVQYAEDFGLAGSSYRFDRNYARLVYDEPNQYRRWLAGDLTPEIRGQQGYVQLGGVGVSRQRRRFDQFRSAILQGNRQIVLQRDSTVEIFRNGSLVKQVRLDAGSYDLSALPLVTGSNDLEVRVRDDAGGIQNIAYRSYLDPIDLQPGDYEYAAYIGRTGQRFGRSPVYSGPLSFTGFFRKAFLNRPALGVGLQASERVQVVTGQTQVVLRNGGRVQFDLGLSRTKSSGMGQSLGVAYDQIFDRGGLVDSFSLRADYLSRRFGGLGYDLPDNTSSWSLDAQYARAFTTELTLLMGASYLKSRASSGDTYRLNASTAYRLTPKWSIRGGVDYTRYGISSARKGFGFSLGLVYQPGYRDRAEARHDSSTDTSTVSYAHSSTGQIGSVGYGALVGRDLGSVNAQAYADYTGNRFDASFSQAAYGTGLGTITDRQISTIRVGSSIAFADGHFGIGRRINDSFALLYPHATLQGRSVVAGQSLVGNNYLSKSGTLGAAVNGYLTSYVTQSVQYDVADVPTGYDIGPGVVRVKPPYRAGYALRIGTDAFVSATGTLDMADGKPVPLAGGKIVALDDKGVSQSFFTNSIGRFAIQNLRPGVRYRVELFGTSYSFEFAVPKDSDGLVDLKTVTLPAEK
jgi:outer membrane usher protein